MWIRFILFLLLNFGALALGGLFTGKGVPSEWYANLNKAPWTPPGWVFGAAWTTIMLCFTFYMTYAMKSTKQVNLLIVFFTLQWILNVLWNPVFFYYHNALMGLVVICLLTILVTYIGAKYRAELQWKSLLILPYIVWLLIATSLNAYILVKN